MYVMDEWRSAEKDSETVECVVEYDVRLRLFDVVTQISSLLVFFRLLCIACALSSSS